MNMEAVLNSKNSVPRSMVITIFFGGAAIFKMAVEFDRFLNVSSISVKFGLHGKHGILS